MTKIAISDAAAPWLGSIAAHLAVPAAVRVERTAVRDVEDVLGSVIPNDIVALFAIEGRSFGELCTHTSLIYDYYRGTDRGAIAALKLAHVAIRQTNASDEEPIFAAFRKSRDRSSVVLYEWVVRKPAIGEHPYSWERYVREVHGITATLGREPPLVTVAQAEAVYVLHPTFGRGKVVRRGEGKVTVEFSDATRTLGEAFVTPG